MCWGWTELGEHSPTCQPSLSTCMPGQTYKDSGIWIWGAFPLVHGPPIQFPSPTLTLPLCFLRKKSCTYLAMLNTAGQSPSTSLREKQSSAAQLCSASLSWKINQHILVHPQLRGKILSPSTSRQSFNSKMKIPDTNHTACTLPKWSITQNMDGRSHKFSVSHVWIFTLWNKARSWAMNRASLQGLRQKAASIPPILHKGQILTHLHTESQNSH